MRMSPCLYRDIRPAMTGSGTFSTMAMKAASPYSMGAKRDKQQQMQGSSHEVLRRLNGTNYPLGRHNRQSRSIDQRPDAQNRPGKS